MGDVIFATSGALAGPPAVLATLIAVLILLAIRATVGILGLTITRRVGIFVNGAIGIFFVLFVFTVVSRFRYLA
jgi:hypothetical protein